MKNLLTSIVMTIALISICQCQDTIQSKNKQIISDSRLNQFIGTWEGMDNDGLIFTLVLKPKRLETKRNEYQDLLFGYYRIIRNNDTIVDLMEDSKYVQLENLGGKGRSIKSSLIGGIKETNTLQLLYRDNLNNNFRGTALLRISDDKNSITWELRKNVVTSNYDPNFEEKDFTLPLDFMLTKVGS